MNFATDFFLHSLLAAIVATIWFTIPGLVVLRLLGFLPKFFTSSAILVAPALGFCTYGPFSLVIAYLFGYSIVTLLVSWLIFLSAFGIWTYQKHSISTTQSFEDFYQLSFLQTVGLLIGTGLWSVWVTSNIYPFTYQDGLFVGGPIFDHAIKVSIANAIVRQGFPLIDPLYAPEGQTVKLFYHYGWIFLTSQLKLLTGATGWQAEVANNWFTGFATLNFIGAIAIRFTQHYLAGFMLILFAFGLSGVHLLANVFSPYPYLQKFFTVPPVHGLEVLWIQMMWVPHHVYSALAVVISLWLASLIFSKNYLHIPLAITIGLTTAAAFSSSLQVGAIGLVAVLPILLFMLWRLDLPKQNYSNGAITLLISIIISMIFAIPSIITLTSIPSPATFPLAFLLHPSTTLCSQDNFCGQLGHVILFWLQYLPLNFGTFYLLGMLALFARTVPDTLLEERIFHYLSIGATIGYLLVTQFIAQIFGNNDLAWRSVLVPILLLMTFSAIAITEFANFHISPNYLSKWHPKSLLKRGQYLVLPMTIIGLTIDILGTLQYWRPADLEHTSPENLTIHQGFYRQFYAWTKVREYAGLNDRVQFNPHGYATITPWPASLPYHLFSDRSTVNVSELYAGYRAKLDDKTKFQQQYQLIQNIFSSQPTMDNLRKACDLLKIKVILVDRFDAVWQTDIIEKSGIYQLVYKEIDFKIYTVKE